MYNDDSEQDILDSANKKYEDNALASAPTIDNASSFVIPPVNNAHSSQDSYTPNNNYSAQNRQSYNSPITQANSLTNSTFGVGSILGTICLSAIPVVGLIIMIVFACGAGRANRPERRNLAIALIIFRGIVIAVLFALYNFLSFIINLLYIIAGM